MSFAYLERSPAPEIDQPTSHRQAVPEGSQQTANQQNLNREGAVAHEHQSQVGCQTVHFGYEASHFLQEKERIPQAINKTTEATIRRGVGSRNALTEGEEGENRGKRKVGGIFE